MNKVKGRTVCEMSVEKLSDRLSTMASVSCRGEVWPLMHVFGFFSKFAGGMGSVATERDVACTWVGRSGFIKCSCQGQTRLLGLMRKADADAEDMECIHGMAMAKALRTLSIDVGSVLAVVCNLHQRCSSRLTDGVHGDGGDDGDCERFVVCQSAFGIAVTGHADQVVAAPVRYTRQNTTCMLCDTDWTSLCSHVSLTRHYKRSAEEQEPSAAATGQMGREVEDSATATEEACSEADVLQLISQKPLGIFNCHKATRTDPGGNGRRHLARVFALTGQQALQEPLPAVQVPGRLRARGEPLWLRVGAAVY